MRCKIVHLLFGLHDLSHGTSGESTCITSKYAYGVLIVLRSLQERLNGSKEHTHLEANDLADLVMEVCSLLETLVHLQMSQCAH